MTAKARSLHLDGINFDLEDPAEHGSQLARNYTRLVKHAARVFHDQIPGSQVCRNYDQPCQSHGMCVS